MTDEFANPPIDVSGLPTLDQSGFVPLHRNYLVVSLTAMGLFAVLIALTGTIVASRVDESWIPILVMVVLLGLVAASAVARTLEVRHIAYLIREHDISYRSGVIGRRVETLPFVRVQHARVVRGPIDRAFGLAKLQISTAGPNLTIPGLLAVDADRMKELIVSRAGDVIEDE